MKDEVRIVAYPYNVAAYNASFYSAVEKRGLEVVPGDFSVRWIKKNIGEKDIIHMHWPSFYYWSEAGGISAVRRFLRFIFIMVLLKRKSLALFWTAHNLLPHQRSAIRSLDILGRLLLVRMVDRIFVHGDQVERIVVERFNGAEGKCVKIPHGNWVDDFPLPPGSDEAKASLGLPRDAYVYMMFGHGKPYKNIETVVSAFSAVASNKDYLLIAGHFPDPAYLAQIKNLAAGHRNIRIDANFVPDCEVPIYFGAADIVCIPYREILTSGTTMLAFSFGKPVISIDRGFLRDMVTEESGILIEKATESAVRAALSDVRKRAWSSAAIYAHAGNYTFVDAAEIFCQEAEQLLASA